jgi:hypothetical protein
VSNTNTNNENGTGCIGWILEWAVFVLGAVLMFAKTSELLSAFAPKEWLGYVGIESIYGAVSALMVEGLFVAIKITNDPVLNGRNNSISQWFTNAFIMLFPFAISVFAQPIDAFVISGSLANQPPELQVLVSWGVPMIPGLIVGMLLFKSLISSLPDGILANFGEKSKGGISLPKVSTANLGWMNPGTWFKGKGSANGKSKVTTAPPNPTNPPNP